MNLDTIRGKLERLEDTLCILLKERMQFSLNERAYMKGEVNEITPEMSFFEYFFRKIESVHGHAGRYTDPEEHPFFEMETIPVRNIKSQESKSINVNYQILPAYMNLLSRVCEKGDDNQYGSSVEYDIAFLQALSRRIHLGKYVAQIKYKQETEAYDALISKQNEAGIIALLRDTDVEGKILERVEGKAKHYEIPAEPLTDFFAEVVFPLTIKVEVEYFMSLK